MGAHQETGFMLGDVKVSPSHNTLWAREQSLKLQPKAMAVLLYLAHNYDRVVSNEELIERLWQGRVVTHGSVQKSINALRSALSELVGEQEFIAHYTKRGYQLTVAPQFLTPECATVNLAVDTPQASTVGQKRWRAALGLLLLLGIISAAYKGINWNTLYLPNNHQTVFNSTQGYTNETGHKRSATPHPDNQHIAYIREKLIADHPGETESDIVIRNAAGKDWHIASSNDAWLKLAWSPGGMKTRWRLLPSRGLIPVMAATAIRLQTNN